MVDLIFIGVLLLVSIVILEIFKHVLTKTFLKFIVFLIVGSIVTLAVLNSLSAEDLLENNDNKYVQTGATIATTINDQPVINELREKMRTSLIKLKDKIKESIFDG